MRFLSTAAAALLAVSQVAAATVKRPMANLATREAPIAPKFFIISMFTPEADIWYEKLPSSGLGDLLAVNVSTPGLSMLFPHVHCTEDLQICQVTTGESEINAAATITALVLSDKFDLTSTYFMIGGIAGVSPKWSTLGGIALSRYAVQVALQYEFDAREMPGNFTTGYVGYGTLLPDMMPETCPRMFICAEKLADGSACREPFTRSDNLQRHVRVQHQGDNQKRGLTFIHVVPGPDGKLREERDYFVPADEPRETETSARHRAAAQPEGTATTHNAEGHQRSNGRAAYNLPLPSYPVKASRATPKQQRAITWLTQEARGTAIKAVTRLMGDWGLSPSHTASCLLVPAKWRACNPQQLIRSLTHEDYPHAGSERLELKIDDHQTTFARALSWFRDWAPPRRGIDLDNFLEAGAWRRHDGSHLCGHGLCVNWNHILYEPASVNHERELCFEEARQLRRTGQPVPSCCERHEEPCLLQLAVLTNYEATLVQSHILSRQTGIALAEHTRPRNHRLPTFETRLPLGFAAAGAPETTADTPTSEVARGRIPKPDTYCPICRPRRPFNSAIGLWGHLVHKHPDDDCEVRLAVIKSTAAQWRSYWASAERLPPSSWPTMAKIEKVLGQAASWDDILAWELRP